MATRGKTKKRKAKPDRDAGPSDGADLSAVVLTASIEALGWRLRDAAAGIEEASAAIGRGDERCALDRLFELEPLVFDAGRILSAVFLLAREANRPSSEPARSTAR